MIFSSDEASVRTDYHAGAAWAPVGQAPLVTGTGARRSVTMISAVSARGQVHFEVLEDGGADFGDFAAFCRKLMSGAARPVFLVPGNSRVHRARIVRQFADDSNGKLRLFFPPPCSPELNRDERGLPQLSV